MVISYVVRYLSIEYGIDNPLLSHPALFSSAAGISSFLSIPSRLTIETIFNIFKDRELKIGVGEPQVLSKPYEASTSLMMGKSNDGVASNPSNTSDGTFTKNTLEKIPDLVMDFTKLDSLLQELKPYINSINKQRLIKINEEINAQTEILKGLAAKAVKSNGPIYFNLVDNFCALREYNGFYDLEPVID